MMGGYRYGKRPEYCKGCGVLLTKDDDYNGERCGPCGKNFDRAFFFIIGFIIGMISVFPLYFSISTILMGYN